MNLMFRPPFQAKTQATLTSKIKAGKVPDLPKQYSNDLQCLIRLMLTVDHEKRPSTIDFLKMERISLTLREQDLNNR
jgi:serine/threonine protein kinase